MFKKHKAGWIIVCIWMIIIFLFSNQESGNSEYQSKRVTAIIIHTVTLGNPLPADKEKRLVGQMDNLVRKTAHCCIYTVLAMVCYAAFSRCLKLKVYLIWLYTMGVCLLYSITDEVHQIFVPGRSCEVRDVCIDCGGAFAGCIIMWLIKRKKCRPYKAE